MKILGTSVVWILIAVGVWYFTKNQCKECTDSLQVIKVSTKEFVAPEKETTIPEPKKVQTKTKKKVVFYSNDAPELGSDEDFVSFVLEGTETKKEPDLSDSGFLIRDFNLYEIEDSTDAWKLKAIAYVDGELISFSPSVQINCPPQKILTQIPKFAVMPSAYYFEGSGLGVGGNLLYKNYSVGGGYFPQNKNYLFQAGYLINLK